MKLNRLNKIIPEKWIGHLLFYSFSFAFILLNAWLILKKDTMLGVLIPVVFAILITAIFAYDKLIWLVVFFTPLSIPFHEIFYDPPFDMLIPTEPILFGILLLFLFSVFRGNRIDKEITRHPIALAIYFYLGWMALTSITSSIPLVSIKFIVNRFWYIVVFFFLLSYLFKRQKNIEKFIWLFIIGFVVVMSYTITRHLGYGLYDDKAAHWVMGPFFNDHTSYGAILAMFIPFLFGFLFSDWFPKKYKIWLWGLVPFFLLAELLSYCRAAWLSIIVSLGVLAIIKLKIKFRTIVLTFVSLFIIIFAFQDQILQKLEQNSTDSSANLMNHFTSATNISTDASNLERINRWQCAIAMFVERPVFGWGPGTYAMKYAPYQLTTQRTIISTNSGNGGTAHSEYLGALCESGVLGMLSFLLIVILVLVTGIRAYSNTTDKRMKTLLLCSIMSLVTYYTHGFLNNFLDTDKAAVPFWGFSAIILALDVYIKKQKNAPTENQLEL